jgi:hypothetical protein
MPPMHLPFLDPVFANRQGVFGLPVDVLMVVVAIGLSVAGIVFMRRITHVDPEPRSFRSTTRMEASDLVTRVVIAGLVCAGALAVLLLLVRR